jgi:hypothetical protein
MHDEYNDAVPRCSTLALGADIVNTVPRPRTGIRKLPLALAILLLICAGAGLVLGNSHFELRALAVIAILAAARVAQSARARASDGTGPDAAAAPVTRLFWFVGTVLAALTAISFYALIRDAAAGYHDIVPVYAFAAAAVAFALWASILAARFSR